MDLFVTKSKVVTSNEFSKELDKLNLFGKDVLIYSRLLSFGRLKSVDAVNEIIAILLEHIGSNGTLIIPTYTLNSYADKKFDLRDSKIMSGVLGEYASKNNRFTRTIHPVYSNCVIGKNIEIYLQQNINTCFGKGSFFDLFSSQSESVVLMAGLNFNGPTLYHYYDQKYSAKGRFIKEFQMQMKLDNFNFNITFDSFVKDRQFYENRMNCLANFDALVDNLALVNRISIGDNFIHSISENHFHKVYSTALEVDQEYFLLSSNELWDLYYMKNQYNCNYGLIDKEKINLVNNILR